MELTALPSDQIAIGNDLVYIPDLKKSLTPAFKKRVYTRAEIKQIEEYRVEPIVRYATTWAAKEAVVKSLKQLFGPRLGLKWKDIRILRKGKTPTVKILNPRFKQLAVSLSLSHERDYAFAVVIIRKKS